MKEEKTPLLDNRGIFTDGKTEMALTSTDEKKDRARKERMKALEKLWQISSLKAVRFCRKKPIKQEKFVDVKKTAHSAGFAGLCSCGSPWSCPRCSAMIAMKRSLEIAAAVQECIRAGGEVYFVTYTMQHAPRDELSHLWDALQEGWTSVYSDNRWLGKKSGTRLKNGTEYIVKALEGDRQRYAVAGTVRSTECLWGNPLKGGNGWHLHVHGLMFLGRPLLESVSDEEIRKFLGGREPKNRAESQQVAELIFSAPLFKRWRKGCAKAGVGTDPAAFDFRKVKDDGAEFLGSYLAKGVFQPSEKIGMEVAAGAQNKKGTSVNVTPFTLLYDLLQEPIDKLPYYSSKPEWDAEVRALIIPFDGDDKKPPCIYHPGRKGDPDFTIRLQAWYEWELASKGRFQILWSRRIKDPKTEREFFWNRLLDARGREQTDEEIAAEELGGEVIASIAIAAWERIVNKQPELMGEILDVVKNASTMSEATQKIVEFGRVHDLRIVPPIPF